MPFFFVTEGRTIVSYDECPEPEPRSILEQAPDTLWWRTRPDGSCEPGPVPYEPKPMVGWCLYPGWAVNALKARLPSADRWGHQKPPPMDPTLLEGVFREMGWHPDYVVVHAAFGDGEVRWMLVEADSAVELVLP